MNIDYSKPTEVWLRTIDVHELLPQQEPFVMIGTLVAFSEHRTVTETVIKKENIFVEENAMSAPGLMENIAQTCAARIGYFNKYILKKGVQIGFIGAIRNLEVMSLPKIGDLITTEVTVIEDVMGMTLANATITCNDKVLVTTEIKIAVKGDNEE